MGLTDPSQGRVLFLLLTLFYRGQAEEISVTHSVKAKLGDDVVLPCQMDPPVNAVSMTVEWARPDLSPRFVFVWYDGKELMTNQNKAYSGRGSMSSNKLKTGDLSMTLSRVKTSDNGTYRCYIPTIKKQYFVDLIVGVSSSPAISLVGIDKVSSGVMMDCESKGLYPEPEVLWLDSKGGVLSADPKKSVKGPDGLFNVSSRVTVMRRHNNVFTCKLQQKSINWTSEALVYVPDDFFVVPPSATTAIAFAVLFGLMFAATSGLLVWQRKKNKAESKKKAEEQLLLDAQVKEEHLIEKLKMEEEEQKNITHILETLTGLSKKLETQKHQFNLMNEDTKKKVELRDKDIELVAKMVSQQDGDKTMIKAQGYNELRTILEKDSNNQQERKRELQQLVLGFEKLTRKAFCDIAETNKRKEKIENQVEQIKQQLEETKRQSEGSKNKPLSERGE